MAQAVNEWLSWQDTYKQETEDREEVSPDKLCSYGIKPLDDSLLHIGRNELIVIGADTGHGKSELALSIARHNARNGKMVAIYYLEGGHLEAIRRMKWRDMADKYYQERHFKKYPIDFRKWMYNYEEFLGLSELEAKVYDEYNQVYKDNIFFYPATKEFTVDKLLHSLWDFRPELILSPKLDIDLIIIDHLQYFSLAQSENEITEITRILREVKQLTEYHNTPIILVSHVRKRGKNAGLPTHEDFYGSSNIAKISTTAIMLAPATDKDSYSKSIFPTYLRVVKSRIGLRPNYTFLINFDLTRRSYDKEYQIYRVNNLGEVAGEPLTKEELPFWAKDETV